MQCTTCGLNLVRATRDWRCPRCGNAFAQPMRTAETSTGRQSQGEMQPPTPQQPDTERLNSPAQFSAPIAPRVPRAPLPGKSGRLRSNTSPRPFQTPTHIAPSPPAPQVNPAGSPPQTSPGGTLAPSTQQLPPARFLQNRIDTVVPSTPIPQELEPAESIPPFPVLQPEQPQSTRSSVPHVTTSSNSVPVYRGGGGLIARGRTGKTVNRAFILFTVGILVVVLLVAVGGYTLLSGAFTPQTPGLREFPTPEPIVTLAPLSVSEPQELYNQAIAREPILSDSLQKSSVNRWDATNTRGTCLYRDGKLHTLSQEGLSTVLCVAQARATELENIAFSADFTQIRGDTAGLVFRSDTLGRKLYLFGITVSGVYTLSVLNQPDDLQTRLIAGGLSPAIKTGLNTANQLTIIGRDSTLYLYINGQFVTQVNDTTHKSGSIGLFSASAYNGSTEVAFNNVRVWSV